MQYIIKEQDNKQVIFLFKNNRKLPIRLEKTSKEIRVFTKAMNYAVDIDFFCPSMTRCLNKFFVFTDDKYLRGIYFG